MQPCADDWTSCHDIVEKGPAARRLRDRVLRIRMRMLHTTADTVMVKWKYMKIDRENLHEIYFAGGCFWGVEQYLASIPGVTDAVSGYANGTIWCVPKYAPVQVTATSVTFSKTGRSFSEACATA